MNYNNLLLKVLKEYKCEVCDYNSRNKNNFAKHLNTRKHKNYSWDDLHKKDTILTNKIQRLSQKLNYKIK